MGEMTNEEKITVLEESRRQNEIMRDNPTTFWKSCDMESGVESAKKRIEALDAAIYALHSAKTGEPLTLEQLRGMDGQPVWIMESPDWGHWELSEDAEDYLADRDTALYGDTYSAQDCNGGEHQLRWIAYAYPPVHIDREAWEPCEYCNGGRTLYQKTNSTKLIMNTFGMATTLVTECSSCPPHADCCMKDISTNSAFRIKFCPECGRPLTEEAWAELEKREMGCN